MPPRPTNAIWLDILLLVVRALGRGVVERKLQAAVGLDFPLGGLKADHPRNVTSPFDLNLTRMDEQGQPEDFMDKCSTGSGRSNWISPVKSNT